MVASATNSLNKISPEIKMMPGIEFAFYFFLNRTRGKTIIWLRKIH
jgi:hypothetical protein